LKCSILSVGNKRRLGSTGCFLSANGIYVSLSERLVTQPMKQPRTSYSKKCTPTIPFLAECFRIFNHFPTFCMLMEYLAFCSDHPLMVFAQSRERRAILSTRHTDADTAPRGCFSPASPAPFT